MQGPKRVLDKYGVSGVKRMKRRPEAGAGYFGVIGGAVCLGIGVLSSLSAAERLRDAACGLMALSWGLREVVAAKKWDKQPEQEHYARTAEERRESERYEKLEKSGSMQNVMVLFGWSLVLVVVVATVGLGCLFLFHRR